MVLVESEFVVRGGFVVLKERGGGDGEG